VKILTGGNGVILVLVNFLEARERQRAADSVKIRSQRLKSG
jgi:hypothetical protein